MELLQNQLEKYSDITNQLQKDLPSPKTSYIDKACQDFCNSIITAAKRTIPRDRRNKYKPYWDAECEDLCQDFFRAPRGVTLHSTVAYLLTRLDEKDTTAVKRTIPHGHKNKYKPCLGCRVRRPLPSFLQGPTW